MTVNELIQELLKLPNQESEIIVDLHNTDGEGLYCGFQINDQDSANGGPVTIWPEDIDVAHESIKSIE